MTTGESAAVCLDDGSDVLIRPVEPGDRERVRAVYEGLSDRSRRRRFLTPTETLSDEDLDYLTDVDHRRHEAMIAIDPERDRAVGIARYVRVPRDREAGEVAVEVVDDWHRRGLAKALLERLNERARTNGIVRYTAVVSPDNEVVLGALERAGAERTGTTADGEVELAVRVPSEGLGDYLRAGLRAAGAARPAFIDQVLRQLPRLEAGTVIGLVPGVAVGHWTDEEARTGCTAIILPEGTVASGEVRGGAPATREWELLDPQRTVDRVDAVMLCGGSAFGLAAADGAMAWLERRGRGFPTPAGRVPIVVAAALFDLDAGDPSVRPGPDGGHAACEAAREGPSAAGPVGAGTGATVGAWRGDRRPGGIGGALERADEVVVAALVAVNAFGDLRSAERLDPAHQPAPFESTTLAVVVTNARLDKRGCLLVSQSAHDGLARALEPVHTAFDGDAAVTAATGAVDAPVETVRLLAARAVEDAVRSVLSEQPYA